MLLSVIVPVFNTEKYLNVCIDSILNQTFEDFELILVNDGSTDNSGMICDEYAKRYAFIKVIHRENKGVANARKTGFEAATGDYISYVDSDDFIEDNMYTAMMDAALRTQAEIVSCNIIEESANVRILTNRIDAGFYDRDMLERMVYNRFVFDFSVCEPGVIPSLCNKIIKRELLCDVIKNMSGDVTFGEDAIWSFASIAQAKSLYVAKEAFYHYRKEKSFTAQEYDRTAFDKIILLSEELEKQLCPYFVNYGKQVYGYIIKYILECIRGELLYNKNVSFKERYFSVKKKLSDERIQLSLRKSIPEVKDKKLKLKLWFAYKKALLPLFIPFYFNSLRKD